MQYGGMPLAVLKSENEKKEYLRQLFDTTYFRDIIERNHLRRSESLDELCNILSKANYINGVWLFLTISNYYFSLLHFVQWVSESAKNIGFPVETLDISLMHN